MTGPRRATLICVFVCLWLSGCGGSTKNNPTTDPATEPPTTSSIESDMPATRVSGPYSHGSLTLFLLHTEKQDEERYLTLEEGLKQGVVKVTELENETVGNLRISNDSEQPLYLQEGERLQGGKQDRTIAASLVLAPKSGPSNIPTFCIEQSRWAEGSDGRRFRVTTASVALAPKGVRGAAKYEGSQGEVWRAISAQKDTAKKEDLASNTNSSANELYESPQVRKLSDEYGSVFADKLRDHPDAMGMVMVVNGQIEEVNLYPNHALLSKFLPRMVQSYALQSAMLKEQTEGSQKWTSAQVSAFLKETRGKAPQTRSIDAYNVAITRELIDNKFQCATQYNGKMVHWQLMKKNGESDAAKDGAKDTAKDVATRGRKLGSKW